MQDFWKLSNTNLRDIWHWLLSGQDCKTDKNRRRVFLISPCYFPQVNLPSSSCRVHKHSILFSDRYKHLKVQPAHVFRWGTWEGKYIHKHKIHGVRTRSQTKEQRIWQTQDVTELCEERSQAEKSRAVNYSTAYCSSVHRVEQVHEIKCNTFHLEKQQESCKILV